MGNNGLQIIRSTDFDIASLDSQEWAAASVLEVSTYWSGETAPAGRAFEVQFMWSASSIYVRFRANQAEPLIVSEQADITRKIRGLWNRDVCEIYIAPDRSEPNKYFEFEIAPNGEWIDVRLDVTPDGRVSDWDFESKMESAARIDESSVVMAIKIPFRSLGRTPKSGDVWLGNLFRCVGEDPTRGYLAWQPTKTTRPSFHVPEAFGEFHFC